MNSAEGTKNPLCLTFLDWEKAFDKIEHDKLKGATPLHTLVEDWPSNKEIDLGSLRSANGKTSFGF